MIKILVLAEVKNAEISNPTLELMSQAIRSNAVVEAVLIGGDDSGLADVLAGHGAATVYVADDSSLTTYSTSPYTAALREAEEEIGLPPRAVTVVGLADRYRTVTGFEVTPVLGVIPPDLPLRAQESEVASWFEVPLAYALDPANRVRREVEFAGALHHYYEIFWEERRIWGITAAILANLSRRLGHDHIAA